MLDRIYYHILATKQSKLALATVLWCILHSMNQPILLGIVTSIPVWIFIILLFVKVVSDIADSSFEKLIKD